MRCRNGPSHGPSYRQHRVPGIWGGNRGLFGGMVSVLRYGECAIWRAGLRGGSWIPSGGSDGISRESGIASRAPACSLWPAIAVTISRSARATRGMEMSNPYIAHSGEAEGARVHEKGTSSAIRLLPKCKEVHKEH